jgi:hypothetical protein
VDYLLERRLVLYALAAGAVLSSAPASQAKVVFTPSHAVVGAGHLKSLNIDLAHDGTTGFIIEIFQQVGCSTCKSSSSALTARGQLASSVMLGSFSFPYALRAGAKIGSSAKFSLPGRAGRLASWDAFQSGGNSVGNFLDVSKRALGVRFMINGQPHYGWIGFRSVTGGFHDKHSPNIIATLVGWAYETEPNVPIRAGEGFREPESVGTLEPTSLELLARGHDAVAVWRRRHFAWEQT